MSFRKIPLRVLGASLAYLVGLLIYRLVAHHSLPHWSDLPTYLEILAAFVLSIIATEWFVQRRTKAVTPPRSYRGSPAGRTTPQSPDE